MAQNFLEILSGSPRTLEDDFDAQFGAPPIDVSNVLAQALGPVAPQVEAPRQEGGGGRRSVLDIIGGLGDVFATVGGSEAMYQPRIDAATARNRAETDQSWKEKFNAAKLTRAGQEQEAAGFDMTTARQGRLGQAVRGLSSVFQSGGAPAALKAWPLLAKQLGISDEEAAAVGEQIAANPEQAIAGLNAALNPPSAQGSQPKEMQIAAMLEKVQGPEARDRYLNSLSNPDALTAYQAAQMQNMERNFNYRQGKDQRDFDWKTDPRNPANQPKEARGGKAGGAKAEVASNAASDAKRVTGELRGIYNTLHERGATVDPKQTTGQNIGARLRNSGVGQLIEGALGTADQTERDKITGIRPALVQAIAKATGMTAAQLNSDKDMKLMMDQATDPTMGYGANIAAINRIDRLIESRTPAAPRSTGATPGRRPPPPRQNSRGNGAKPSVSNW